MNANWTCWDAATSAEMLQPEKLERADHAFWVELCVQCLTVYISQEPDTYNYYSRLGLTWATHVGVALHGLPFMVEVALDLARRAQQQVAFLCVVTSQFEPLRQAIAACSDAEHDEVILMLERQAGATPLDRLLRVELCPHRTDWVLASFADDVTHDNLFLRGVAPIETLRRYLSMRKATVYDGGLEGALALQIHLHGAGAFDVLADQLRRAVDRESSEKLTALVMRMQVPQVVGLLAELIERKEVRLLPSTSCRSATRRRC